MTASVAARVFVVGCPRSGTTVVQSLVGAHRRVRAFPESHFFARAAAAPRPEALRHLREFLTAAGVALPAGAGDLAPVDAFVRALDAATLADGADVWSEKTPRHLHHVDAIAQGVELARFVHVLRRGADVVRSLARVTREAPEHWGGRPRSLVRCVRRWESDVRTSLRYLDDPAHHLVRYESVTEHPAEVAAGLCAFLGLEPDAEMLERRPDVARAVTVAGESWKDAAAGPLRALDHAPAPPDLEERLAETQALVDHALGPGR